MVGCEWIRQEDTYSLSLIEDLAVEFAASYPVGARRVRRLEVERFVYPSASAEYDLLDGEGRVLDRDAVLSRLIEELESLRLVII